MTVIRPFRPGDEPALAEICLKTADAGSDATGILADDLLWGDLFVLPYVARHPDLAWVVANDDDRAIGYVVGTDDTDAFDEWFRKEWWPPRIARFDRVGERQRQLLHDADSRGAQRESSAAAYPAHLHIDLLPVAQGSGLGRRLVDTLLDELARRGVPGLHLGADPQNVAAAAFYDRLGFERLPSPEGSVMFGIRIPPRDRSGD